VPGMSGAAILDLWERVGSLDRLERTLELAAAAEPPVGVDESAALPLGRRDARLIRLRMGLAGDLLEATASCPECGELVEFASDASELLAREDAQVAPAPVEVGAYAASWRPPDSRDVAEAAAAGGATAAERVLLERCVTSATGPHGADLTGPALPGAVRDAVSAAMARADPLAEVLVDLTCPACTEPFVAELDIASFVWAELAAHGRRLLGEVDELARAYGWTEREVLALGDRRRAAYLRLVREGAA
jgi:hypothetical protein